MAEKSDQDEGSSQGNDPGEGQPRRGRGFAGMDAERQRQISAEGGRAAHRKGTAHEFDSEEAREAGRKGGQASGGSRRRRSSTSDNSGGSEGTEHGEHTDLGGESGGDARG
jgi:general stress protein YciG